MFLLRFHNIKNEFKTFFDLAGNRNNILILILLISTITYIIVELIYNTCWHRWIIFDRKKKGNKNGRARDNKNNGTMRKNKEIAEKKETDQIRNKK